MPAVRSPAKPGKGDAVSAPERTNREARRHPERFGIPVAAERLGLSERHVRRLIFERRLAHYKVGSRIVLSAEDCEAFLASQRREAIR
jgi:excisionase family DNA binding protein